MRLQGDFKSCCYSVNDGSEMDVDSHVVQVLWEGPGLLSVHVPISFHTPSFCLLPHCLLSTRSPLRVLTNDSTDFDYHSEVPLMFVSQPTNPSPLSQLVIKSWRVGTRIHRFSDESPPQNVFEERTINSIPIPVCFFPSTFTFSTLTQSPQYSATV